MIFCTFDSCFAPLASLPLPDAAAAAPVGIALPLDAAMVAPSASLWAPVATWESPDARPGFPAAPLR